MLITPPYTRRRYPPFGSREGLKKLENDEKKRNQKYRVQKYQLDEAFVINGRPETRPHGGKFWRLSHERPKTGGKTRKTVLTPPRLATGRFFADLGRPRSNQKFRRTPLDTDTDYLRSVNFPKARAINGLKDKLAVVALLDGRLHGHCQDCSAVLIRVTDHLERGREQSKCGDLAARSQGTGKIFTVPIFGSAAAV